MKDELLVLCIVCLGIWMCVWVTRQRRAASKEGMTAAPAAATAVPAGIAGGAAAYAAALKVEVSKLNDALLVGKYQSDYEQCILTLDDLISAQMLQAVLSADPSDTTSATQTLGTLMQAKLALNATMKFVDGQQP